MIAFFYFPVNQDFFRNGAALTSACLVLETGA